MTSLHRRPGRPPDPEKAATIVDAAWSLFLERGVETTSVEAIAALAGVSKVTLYRLYPDRTALFEAAILREMERIERAQSVPFDMTGSPDVQSRLRVFGTGLMQFLVSKPAVDFYNVIAGELRRHPPLARAFYDLGPGRTRANLTVLIAEAARQGELTCADPAQGAEDLFGLWQGMTNFQLALDIEVSAIEDDIAARVERGIATFMNTYGPAR